MSPGIFPEHPEIHFLIRWRQKSEGRLILASSSGQFQNPGLEHSAWSWKFNWRFGSIFLYLLVIEPLHFLIVVFAFRISIKLLTKNIDYNQRNSNFVALLSFCVSLYFWNELMLNFWWLRRTLHDKNFGNCWPDQCA